MIYFINCNLVEPDGRSTVHIYTQTEHTIQQYSTHLHTNSTQNNTMKHNTQNKTHVTIKISKHNNKNTQFTK
jgi:hypothetical protein